jgi:hypothetical protein
MGSKSINTKFNPFPGLRPFLPEESDLFFGREGQSSEVVSRLRSTKFVTVIGASGSGKSSLIFCGVVPLFIAGTRNSASECTVITMKPGNDPAGNLADAIIESGICGNSSNTDRGKLINTIQTNPSAISSIIAECPKEKKQTLLIIIDQFEELFRYGMIGSSVKQKEGTDAFINLIVKETLTKNNNVFFILTMRSDFIGECAHYQGLTQLINDSNYLIPHMTRVNYRSVITGPVEYAGAKIDAELVDNLLDDVGDRTDQLPVLQHAMMRTWLYWQQAGQFDRPLGISDYDAIGRMTGAMSRHADEAYEELTPRGRAVCEIMFRTITEKGSDNRGVRHPTDVSTISAIAKCSYEEVFEVADRFRIPSRSFITPRSNTELTKESVIDISHESLMRLWDRLRLWVDEESSSVQMYLRLSDASAMYQRGKAGLWRPPDLQLAINWREKNNPSLTWAERYNPAFERAMVYLATSEKEFQAEEESKIRIQKRQLKRSRIIAIILGTAAIISLGFMLFAFIQKLEADNQTQLAKVQEAEAIRQSVRADSSSVVANTEKQRAELNASKAISKEAEARREKERAETQRLLAEMNAAEAKRQEEIALTQSDSANQARLRADRSAQEATEQKNTAMGLRMLAVGKQMSVKSLQMDGQKDLQTLLAYQAYIFNKRHQGVPNDADIYAGLYSANKTYGGENYKVFKAHQGEINSIAFVPGKNEFYTSGRDGKIIRWILDGKPDNFEIIYTGLSSIEVLAVSPDASWIAAGDDNAVIRMIPLTGNNNVAYELRGHAGEINSLVFSYDGKYLYTAALDGKALKWDIAARTSKNLNDDSVRITQIDVSRGGRYIAGVTPDGKVLLLDPDEAGKTFTIETGEMEVKTIRFEPSKNLLALGDVNGLFEVWDVEKNVRVHPSQGGAIKGHTSRISGISFNPVYNQMATSSYDGSVKIWNMNDITEPPITLNDNEGQVLTISFSSKGDALLSATSRSELVSRASHADILAGNICFLVTRNLTDDEWKVYVGRDIDWEATCPDKDPVIKVERR